MGMQGMRPMMGAPAPGSGMMIAGGAAPVVMSGANPMMGGTPMQQQQPQPPAQPQGNAVQLDPFGAL